MCGLVCQDFGVPSLKVAANNDNPNSDKVAQHQIAEERKWDKRYNYNTVPFHFS